MTQHHPEQTLWIPITALIKAIGYGLEIGALCERIGIHLDDVDIDVHYLRNQFEKSTGTPLDAVVAITFATKEDAAAFRLAAPPRYFADIEDI